ncbi:hypothetical protein [Psychroserpens sp. NJDZ02]|uniref:hypothetical protein n=1 Tax=Psychroserpens sp. NJDZ02 TaxID=2570561 RepID=UPI0010A8808D|nr:hypothetical protein [Psychroserpens sp. NJDZ02]QCE42441.1 hypothetical protein E9099_13870 [Psychroserpens sp. NJDZ02]
MIKILRFTVLLVLYSCIISCSQNFSIEKFELEKDNKKFDSVMHNIIDQKLYKTHQDYYSYYNGAELDTGPVYKPERNLKLWSHRSPKYITTFYSKNKDSVIFFSKINKLWKEQIILDYTPAYKDKNTQKYVLDTLNLMGFISIDSKRISDTDLLNLTEEYFTIEENKDDYMLPFNQDGTASPYKKIVKEYLEFK